MKATFIELPSFQRLRDHYLDDTSFRALLNQLMSDPDAGAVITGTGGLRKIRVADERRGKGKRGAACHLLLEERGQSVLAVYRLRQGRGE